MAWPIVLAHWWLRRQTFSPNVRFSHFFYPAPSAGLLLARRLCKSGALKFLSARSF